MPPASQRTKFNGMYRGQVFDNNDPLKQGRIKVQVWPMFSEIIVPDLLPWAVPAMPLWGGAGSGFGMMAIPAVGSHVFCFFEAGDPYQPVYFAEAQNAVAGIPAEVAGNYPFTRVMKSPSGVKIIVDDAQGSIQIVTPLQSTFLIDQTGKITVASVAGMDLSAVVDIAITAGGLLNVAVTGLALVNVGGTVTVNATGNVTVNTQGDAAVNAQNDATVAAIRDANVQAGRNGNLQAGTQAKVEAPTVVIHGFTAVNIN